MSSKKEFIDYVAKHLMLFKREGCSREVEVKENGVIFLTTFDGEKIILSPQLKKINLQNRESFESDVNSAFQYLSTNSLQELYLVYPKSKEFRKHLTIVSPDSDKRVKLIPYKMDR